MRIEQTLRRLEGVVHSRSDVRTGMVWAAWSPSAPLDLDQLKARLFVWRGAVRFGTATATIVGTVCEDDRGRVLEAGGTGQRFRLAAPPLADTVATAAWNTLASLPREPGARVRVTGEVRRGSGPELTVVVASVEPIRRPP